MITNMLSDGVDGDVDRIASSDLRFGDPSRVHAARCLVNVKKHHDSFVRSGTTIALDRPKSELRARPDAGPIARTVGQP